MPATKDIFKSYDKFKHHAMNGKVTQYHTNTSSMYVARDEENGIIVSMELSDMMGRKDVKFIATYIETSVNFADKFYKLTKHQLGALRIKATEDFPVLKVIS